MASSRSCLVGDSGNRILGIADGRGVRYGGGGKVGGLGECGAVLICS
jgi:hypothetical protein